MIRYEIYKIEKRKANVCVGLEEVQSQGWTEEVIVNGCECRQLKRVWSRLKNLRCILKARFYN